MCRSGRPALLLPVSLLLLASAPAFGDAGMWTFHDFPQDLVKRQYGADISSAWLDRVRSATLRLSNCTASFVSPAGLILTNHHCAEGCLDEHSTSEQNLLRGGFLARSREQELKCGTQIADVLMSVENVTDRVAAAIRGLDDRAANDTRKKTLTQLEQACEQESQHARSGPLKCESVDLYQGGQYWLYKYHRYDDVRLVFAPERGIAAFGGDPDNFQFPRWCLDMALLRAYGPNGKPAATPNFLALRPEGPQAGELVFVSGHPGTTERLLTVAQLAAATGDPWTDIAKAQLRERELYLPYTFLEAGAGFNSRLFSYARTLVRGAAERPKPNTERLREYRDAALARIAQRLGAPVPLYPALDKLTLSFALERMREWLGPDDPIVRSLLAKDSPDMLAARLVDGSQLADPKLRQRLWDGGAAALEAAHDPMIEFARSVDAPARAVRKRYEDEVEAPVDAAAEKIARARFRVYGTSVPPDATFTLRLNVGTVQGWKEDGHEVEPFTRLARLFERATGQEPFRIPDSWLRVQGALDRETRFDLSTSNDIVGGNSGSPLIDTGGRLVGLMFDGNIHSIAGSFWFDPELNRAVAVDPAIMFEALRKVYQADGLLAELGRR